MQPPVEYAPTDTKARFTLAMSPGYSDDDKDYYGNQFVKRVNNI
jgi:hypothetical protein